MRFLNFSTVLIFLGVIVQSFCSFGLIYLRPITVNVLPDVFDSVSATGFATSWIILTFFSRIVGAYILGKYSDSNGFLKTQKILVSVYAATAVLFCFCCFYFSHLHEARHFIILIASLNIFLFPATLIAPSIYLMKTSDFSKRINAGALIFLSTIIGHGASYCTFHYFVKGNLRSMSIIFVFSSLLCFLVYHLGKKFWKYKKNVAEEKNQRPSNTLEKIMTWLIGSVAGAGITHHYFFLKPYRQDVLVIDSNTYEFLYLFLYVVMIVCLAVYIFISSATKKLKLMTFSVSCLLMLCFSFKVFCQNNEATYAIYQILFALSLSSFLAPSMGLIFSFFKNDQPFFNSLFWFYSGVSFSFLSSYLLNKHFGLSHRYLLFLSPLIFSGVLFLVLSSLLQSRIGIGSSVASGFNFRRHGSILKSLW